MLISFTKKDWVTFSLSTRRELRRFMTDQFQALEDEDDKNAEKDKAMYDLNDQMLERFMIGVSKITEDFLACFVKDGVGRVDELLEATGYESMQNFKGVLGGITRRMRKLFSDPDAYIIDWEDDESDKEYGGYYYVKDGTRKALENYFEN